MAAMIKMMATTISNSISEKPFVCYACVLHLSLRMFVARARHLYLQA